MLKTRIITALILAALLIPAIFLSDRQTWSLLTAGVTVIAGWEFARLAGFAPRDQWRFGGLVGVVLVGILFGVPADEADCLGRGLMVLSAVFWLGVVPLWLRARWQGVAHWRMALVGLVVLLPTWAALVALRERAPGWLFAALLFVALADIAAYFFGRAFGRRKLAPQISPGKTWEGAWGAMFTVTLLAMAVQVVLAGADTARLLLLAVCVPLLTLVSISGDLFESMLKRQVGLKDSSQLLPGHGGVMDRIDSHTAALPMIALLLTWLA